MIEIEHLDLNVVRMCNMRCVSCSHMSPFTSRWSMPLQTIERDLKALQPILKPHSVNVVGGEPTLHKQLVSILELLKSIRIDTETVVITNATLLAVLPETFWQLLECLKISIYATTEPEVLELAETKSAQYGFRLISESFPTFFQQFKSQPDDSCFHRCPWKSDCYTVHEGRFYLCPQSAFMGAAPYPTSIKDGLPLEGITEEKLRAFMDRAEPLVACRNCAAADKIEKPWAEAHTYAEWLSLSTVQ